MAQRPKLLSHLVLRGKATAGLTISPISNDLAGGPWGQHLAGGRKACGLYRVRHLGTTVVFDHQQS